MTDRLLTETDISLLNFKSHGTLFFYYLLDLFLGIVLEASAPGSVYAFFMVILIWII